LQFNPLIHFKVEDVLSLEESVFIQGR